MTFDFDRARNPFLKPSGGRIGVRDSALHYHDGVLRCFSRLAAIRTPLEPRTPPICFSGAMSATWSSQIVHGCRRGQMEP